MALRAGTKLGPYEIVAAIGAGGMGEVYRARDPRLGRDVAIKVLPAACSLDPDRLQRFEQEARAAAALNHPNILAVFDIGTHDRAPYIVSELLEGETLRTAGAAPLSVRKAIDLAIQLARGLAAAHAKGIVHRDLKPANIFITSDGRVKILDFGLAKLTVAEPALAGASALPTTPVEVGPGAPKTAAGTLLGTIGYMSPEQVRGLPADHRSDIFAFGAVLYEMLSGRRAFQADTTADTMTAILKDDPPDLPAVERHIPPALQRTVDRCLEKNAAARFQSTDDLAFALEGLSTQSEAGVLADRHRPTRLITRERVAWSAAVLLAVVAALVAGGMRYFSRVSNPEAPLWLSLSAPERDFGPSPAPAVSPDGRTIVFAAPDKSGQIVLWIRPLDAPTARALPGTEGAGEPFWSPDGRSVGFFAGGKLKRADVTGGSAPQVLADAPNQRGGTWSRDGVIVFGPALGLPLYRVSAAGGLAVPLQLDKADEQSPRYPLFLPDGRHFLFTTVQGPEAARGVWAGSLDSAAVVRVGDMRSRVTYSGGCLLFGRGRELYAQPFDPARLQLSGEPIRIAEDLSSSASAVGWYMFSTSASDVLAYGSTGFSGATTQPRWLDRRGTLLGVVGEPGMYSSLVLSPDERQLAVERFDPATNTTDVWTIDVRTGVASRFTADPDGIVMCPLWAAGGSSIVFYRIMSGTLRVASLDGKKTDDIPVAGAGEGLLVPTAWSPDGRFVVLTGPAQKTLTDLWLLPLAGDRTPRPYLQTPFNETTGRVSPDSRWLAYVSDESGRADVYVQSFPVPGSKQRVSTSGGRNPLWNTRGTELYYLSLDGKLMAAGVNRSGSSLELSPPRALFDAPPSASPGGARFPYAVTADGQRFLFNAVTTDAVERRIVVGIHWPAALKK